MTNEELNAFSHVPTNQTLKRSGFDLSHSNKLTAKVGKLIPFECMEIYPGDTFNINQDNLARSLTPIFPTMDNAFLDIFWFFVPNRLCYLNDQYQLTGKTWKEIQGENTQSYWAAEEETEAFTEAVGNIKVQSIFDYLGMPTGDFSTATHEEMNVAPAIAVGLIWSEFFRDQNIQAPITDWSAFLQFAREDCLDVNKFHDYFTSALPAPQKGDPVGIGLAGFAPITADSQYANVEIKSDGLPFNLKFKHPTEELYASMYFKNDQPIETIGSTQTAYIEGNGASQTIPSDQKGLYASGLEAKADIGGIHPQADLSQATAININDLRIAFAAQKMLERDARSGTRYIENLKARWNITIKDETLQRPQYLGGKRIPLNIQEINQTSATNETSPLGRPGAVSKTSGQTISFTASFKEHGYLIGVLCIRLSNTYKKGKPLIFSRKNRLDYYNPEFANIGEQPIKQKELFLSNNDVDNEATYGFKEAWSELRYESNKLKGYFKDESDLMLQAWTYAQNFADAPTLNSDFIKQSREPFLKTISSSETPYDYIIDIWESITAYRPLPTFSIPSLIDHN